MKNTERIAATMPLIILCSSPLCTVAETTSQSAPIGTFSTVNMGTWRSGRRP